MMKIHILFYLIVALMASCNFGKSREEAGPAIFTDTLAYTVQNFKERAADCGDKADSACTVVKVSYPVFKGQPVLNDTITRRLTALFAVDNKPDSSIGQMAKTFLKSYADAKKGSPAAKMVYMMDSYAKVVDQDSARVSLEYGGYTYQGGAHGSAFTGFINFNPKNNKNISLDDILIPDYRVRLTKIAEAIFRKEEKLKDTSSLARDYFFKNNRFALNNNYLLTPLGIRFVYNQYDIKPYAAGQTELIIPYGAIKTLIRPDAVVAKYITNDAGI